MRVILCVCVHVCEQVRNLALSSHSYPLQISAKSYLKRRPPLRRLGEEGAVSLEVDGGSRDRKDVLLLPPSFPLPSPSTLFSAILKQVRVFGRRAFSSRQCADDV